MKNLLFVSIWFDTNILVFLVLDIIVLSLPYHDTHNRADPSRLFWNDCIFTISGVFISWLGLIVLNLRSCNHIFLRYWLVHLYRANTCNLIFSEKHLMLILESYHSSVLIKKIFGWLYSEYITYVIFSFALTLVRIAELKVPICWKPFRPVVSL